MAAHYAISLQDDDAVIKQRLLTRTTVTRGEPPLKKLIRRFTAFSGEVEREGDNLAECEKAYRALLQELATFELPLSKTQAVIDANRREQESFHVLQQELDSQIIQAQGDIAQLKVQLDGARAERRHLEDCENRRRMISAQPGRRHTEAAIAELEEELVALEAANLAGLRQLDLRKKQFSLLMHLVEELQSTVEDDDDAAATGGKGGGGMPPSDAPPNEPTTATTSSAPPPPARAAAERPSAAAPPAAAASARAGDSAAAAGRSGSEPVAMDTA
eukprot:jgi/Mesen1/6120/ME000311S05208